MRPKGQRLPKQKQNKTKNFLLDSWLAPTSQRTSSWHCWPAASWGSRRTHRSGCWPGLTDHICHPSTTKIGQMEQVVAVGQALWLLMPWRVFLGAVGQALWLLMAWTVVLGAVWSVVLACWSWSWCCWPCCCCW